MARDIGRYCIFKIKCLAVNGTGGVLSIRVATLPSDRLKGSEGREGVKTLWSALAEFRCRWDSRRLGGQVSLVVYEGLTLILTFCPLDAHLERENRDQDAFLKMHFLSWGSPGGPI